MREEEEEEEERQHPSSGDPVATEDAVIRVYVRELEQLFDSWDPSPFHERDLDTAAEEYIVAYAKELATRVPPALLVYLDKPLGLPEEASVLGEAIRKHFARRAQLLRFELRRLIRLGTISLVIGLTALAAALVGGEYLTQVLGRSRIASVMGASLQIGGWVAMARPMEIFLYEWWPVLGRLRLYERLSRMPVRIVYTDTETGTETGTETAQSPSISPRHEDAPQSGQKEVMSWPSSKSSECSTAARTSSVPSPH